MSAPATEPAPSPWEVTNDYSKTVITLSSGFLALTVTFAAQLVSKETPQHEKVLLVTTWIFLVLSIATSIITVMLLVNFLQHGRKSAGAVFFANASFILLLLAGLSFLIFGSSALVFNTRSWDAPTTVEKTLEKMPTFASMPDSKWLMQSLRWDEPNKIYVLEVVEQKTGTKFSVHADSIKNKFPEVRRLP